MKLALKVIPPFQFTTCAALMFGLAYFFPKYNFSLVVSFFLSIFLIILASIIAALALYEFHKHKTTVHPHTPEKTSTIVNSGIFAYSRNPMYLALVLALISLALYFTNLTCFAVIPFFIWYITRYQIKPEEIILGKLFPQEYESYCQRVRRWL